MQRRLGYQHLGKEVAPLILAGVKNFLSQGEIGAALKLLDRRAPGDAERKVLYFDVLSMLSARRVQWF